MNKMTYEEALAWLEQYISPAGETAAGIIKEKLDRIKLAEAIVEFNQDNTTLRLMEHIATLEALLGEWLTGGQYEDGEFANCTGPSPCLASWKKPHSDECWFARARKALER